MSLLSELNATKHIRALNGRAASVADSIASYYPQEGDNGLVLLAKLLKRLANGVTDNGPAWTTVRGVAGVPVASADMTTAANVTDAPTSDEKLVIDDILVSVGATAMSLTFTDETSGAVIHGPLYFAANSTQQITLRGKTKLPVANSKLKCTASAAGNVTIEATYHSEA